MLAKLSIPNLIFLCNTIKRRHIKHLWKKDILLSLSLIFLGTPMIPTRNYGNISWLATLPLSLFCTGRDSNNFEVQEAGMCFRIGL